LWETIAVPELRVQVSDLSRLLLTVSQGKQSRPEENSQAPQLESIAAFPRQLEV
jgi:hypothetical protein